MAKKKKFFWLIVALALIAGGYYYFKSRQPEVEYTTAAVQKGDLAQTVSITGTVNPKDQVDLAFMTGGRLESVGADVGDRVSKGQVLAKLDTSDLEIELRKAKAEVEEQKKLLVNMKNRPSTYKKAQKEAQRQVIEGAEAAADAISQEIKEAALLSPIDGVVTKRNYDAGEMIAANAAALTVSSEGDLEIHSNIPESDIVKIKTGQKASVDFDALPAREIFEAKVSEIDPASTVIQDVVYYRIKLKILRPDERLKPGMTANVDIKTDERRNVLIAPLRALKTEGGQKSAEILRDGNAVEVVRVETGLEGDEGMVEIKSGLKEGDKVVTFTKNL